MIGHTFSSCDPVPPALRAKVRIEVHQHFMQGLSVVAFRWLGGGNAKAQRQRRWRNVPGVNVPLTEAQKKEKKLLQKKKYRSPSHSAATNTVGTSHHNRDRTTQQLANLAKLS